MAQYGLQRGVRGSEATAHKHYAILSWHEEKERCSWYGKQIVAGTESRAETQTSKKVQTEKLESAAMTAAANIVESVSSLFGGGKMKALDWLNKDLQNCILELKEETRQEEYLQAKQIQEIKIAFKQQNSKLSEFVDFTRRYIPYVE